MSANRTAHHVLTFAQSLRGGGVERVQLRLAADWLAAGRRVTLVLGDPRGPLDAELPPGLDIVTTDSPSMLKLMAQMPGIVRARRPDAIFCPGNHYTSIAWWIKQRLGTECPPIVAKISNALGRPDHLYPVRLGYRFWLRRHPGFVDRLVAMTPAMAAEAFALTGVPVSALRIIPNPPSRPIPGGPAPAMPRGRYLLGVGRLAPQKRWERLVAAMSCIADPLVSLALLGEGGERGRLEAQIAQLGLGDRVILLGHVADPWPAIAGAAAVVLVSDFEGVPGVLREALAVGTPVITTDSSVATREIVTGPKLGSIIPPGDESALVAALDHWLAADMPRPVPVPQPGEGAAAAYLALFDELAVKPVSLPTLHLQPA